MLNLKKYLIVVALIIQLARCENVEDNPCVKEMQAMQQRQAQCCPAPDPMMQLLAVKMQKSKPSEQGPKAFCNAYVDLFKEAKLLQDDGDVDNDKFKELMEKILSQADKKGWIDVYSASIDTCAASDKNADMFYKFFGTTKEECNLDSFLMHRCSSYSNQLNCLASDKIESPDCTPVYEYMKKCAKFWYDIDAE